jgi:hypothetical protein
MTTEKEGLLKETRERAEKDVLLEEILRLERHVGLIDGERKGREGVLRTWSTIALIVIAGLGLLGWTYINARIDSAVTSSLSDHVDDVLQQYVQERMANEEFTVFLNEQIDAAAGDVIVDAEKAVNDAEKAVLEAKAAAGEAGDAVLAAEQAVMQAEGAAADAEDASVVAEEASSVVETLATQTSDEAP